jgi:hypothetical protein
LTKRAASTSEKRATIAARQMLARLSGRCVTGAHAGSRIAQALPARRAAFTSSQPGRGRRALEMIASPPRKPPSAEG